MLNPVQKCLNFQLHCGPLVSLFNRSDRRSETKVSFFPPVINAVTRTAASFSALFSPPTIRQAAPSIRAGGERRERTAELQFALPPVATRNGLTRPSE
jgi:hypothetical protein